MSDLLNQASLVMVPSGYKEDTVYSVVPSDGSGDLSFTRASNGTRVNSAGLVEVVPWNLVSYSEEFDNAGWTKSGGSTITSNNTTAPNGTLTADRINLAATIYSGAYQFINQPNGVYANSIYAKAGTFNYLVIFINGSSGYYVWFNLATGTVGSKGASMEGTIESVGDGWYRCTASRILNNDTNAYHQFAFSDAENFTPTTTGTAFIWGAQANIGSTAKPYFPTTDRLNVPRLTYQNGGGGCPSLLLEKQSTNLCLYSEQFDNAAWTKTDGTVTANQAISPDGTQNADKCVGNNGVVTMDMRTASAFSITNGSVYTWSLYVKKAGYRYCQMTAWTADDPITIYDLDNGVVVSETGPSHTSTITSVGNGWYRITITRTASDSFGWLRFSPLADSTASSAQNGTDGFYIWGAQVEPSSYVTSYIQSTSSSATRVADACFKTGISSLIGQTEGTIFLDITLGYNPLTLRLFSLSTATWTDNSIRIDWNAIISDSKIVVEGVLAGAATFQLSSINAYTNRTRVKIAIAYKSNDCVLYIDGVQQSTDTSTGAMPACSIVALNELYGFGSGSFENNNFNECVIFKTRLTNAELASITTI